MQGKSRLKWNRTLLPAVVAMVVVALYIVATIVENDLFGTHYTAWVYGALIIGFMLWMASRANRVPLLRIAFIVLGVVVGTLAWHYELVRHMHTVFSERTLTLHMMLMVVIVVGITPFLMLLKRRLDSYYRRLFELAAEPISATESGYTGRPYPAGQAQYSKTELLEFAHFLERHYLVSAYISTEQVQLALPSLHSSFGHMEKPKPEEASSVIFDYSGNVSAFINPKDYEQYRDRYTFDQLCGSFGKLFIDFLGLYQKGQQEQIIERLRVRRMDSRLVIYGMGMILFLVCVVLYFLARN